MSRITNYALCQMRVCSKSMKGISFKMSNRVGNVVSVCAGGKLVAIWAKPMLQDTLDAGCEKSAFVP